MKTMDDFRKDAVVSIMLRIDGEEMIGIDMQPSSDAGGLGVAIVRWDDFSISDTRDLLRVADGSLTRLLNRDPHIVIDSADLETIEKERPPSDGEWPF